MSVRFFSSFSSLLRLCLYFFFLRFVFLLSCALWGPLDQSNNTQHEQVVTVNGGKKHIGAQDGSNCRWVDGKARILDDHQSINFMFADGFFFILFRRSTGWRWTSTAQVTDRQNDLSDNSDRQKRRYQAGKKPVNKWKQINEVEMFISLPPDMFT